MPLPAALQRFQPVARAGKVTQTRGCIELVQIARGRAREGCASDWTMEQLRESAQRTADCIDELMSGGSPISKDED